MRYVLSHISALAGQGSELAEDFREALSPAVWPTVVGYE
jgi:hypothetical protein